MKKKLLLLTLLTTTLFAEKVVIADILKANYSETVSVEKKSLILTKDEAKAVQEKAEVKLNSKIVRLYKVQEADEVLGYAVLLKRKVRTKNTAVLYMVDNNQTIKAIEIVSFKEPLEYKPNDSWKEVFKGKTSSDTLILGKDVPAISGATMSARSITDMARIALAIVEAKAE